MSDNMDEKTDGGMETIYREKERYYNRNGELIY